nr:unnamed protein product [Callosobruchus chinensis]
MFEDYDLENLAEQKNLQTESAEALRQVSFSSRLKKDIEYACIVSVIGEIFVELEHMHSRLHFLRNDRTLVVPSVNTDSCQNKGENCSSTTYKTHAPQTLRNRKSSKYQYEGRSRRKRIAEDGTKSLELLRGVCTITKPNKTVIDSTILRLHSNSTVVLLITFSIAVTTRQGIPEDILNSYCWIHSTYIIIETVKESKQWGHYPGVHYTGKSPVRLTKYYQWVAFFLLFQGIGKKSLRVVLKRRAKLTGRSRNCPPSSKTKSSTVCFTFAGGGRNLLSRCSNNAKF